MTSVHTMSVILVLLLIGSSLTVVGATSKTTLEEKLVSMEHRLEKLESHVHKRPKRVAGNVDNIPVAFSATLSHPMGLISLGETIVFNKVYVNDGGSYDNQTGVFTAPYDGVYLLSYFIAEYNTGQIVTRLMLDGTNIADSVAESIQDRHNDQGGNLVILKLQMGQRVWLETFDTDNVHIDASAAYLYNTFSGFLLYGL